MNDPELNPEQMDLAEIDAVIDSASEAPSNPPAVWWVAALRDVAAFQQSDDEWVGTCPISGGEDRLRIKDGFIPECTDECPAWKNDRGDHNTQLFRYAEKKGGMKWKRKQGGQQKYSKAPPRNWDVELPHPQRHDSDVQMAEAWLLRYGKDRIIAMVGGDAVLGIAPFAIPFRVRENGVLSSDVAELHGELIRIGEEYAAWLPNFTGEDHRALTSRIRKLNSAGATQAICESIPTAIGELRRTDRWGDRMKGCKIVDITDIDTNMRYLGAPNGIIDLHTGETLSGREHGDKLVSRTIPDAYNPGAKHDGVEKLVSHLEEQDAEWLWDAFGAALHGSKFNARGYFVKGVGDGGKTTLLSCVAAALGVNYCKVFPRNTFAKTYAADTTNAPQWLEFQGPRIMYQSEWQNSKDDVDVEVFKSVCSGDDVPSVTLKGQNNLRTVRPTGVPFFAVNNMPSFGIAEDTGVLRRIRILEYPKLPKPEIGWGDRVVKDRLFRQALVALLVERAAQHIDGPPADIPSVAQATEQQSEDELGEVGLWIKNNVQVTGNVSDRVHTRELWADLIAQAEIDNRIGKDKTAPYGMKSQRSFTMQLRKQLGLPAAKVILIGGRRDRGWAGVRKWDEHDKHAEEMAAEDAKQEAMRDLEAEAW